MKWPAILSITLLLHLLLSFTGSTSLGAQDSARDSISHLLEKIKTGQHSSTELSSTLKKAPKWLQQLQDSSVLFQYHYNLGKLYYDENTFARALKNFEIAYQLQNYDEDQTNLECDLLRYLGLAALEIPIKSRAISFLEEAIACFKSNEFSKKEVKETAFRLFDFLYDFDEYDEAIKLGESLTTLFKEVNAPSRDYVKLYVNMVQSCMYITQYEKADIYLKKAEKAFQNVPSSKFSILEARLRGAQIRYILDMGNSEYDQLLAYMDEWERDFDHKSASTVSRIMFYYRQAGYRAMAYQYDKALEAADSLLAINNVRNNEGRLIVPELKNIRNAHYYNLLRAEIAIRIYHNSRDTSLLRKSLISLQDNFDIYNYNRRTLFDVAERRQSLELTYTTVEWATLIFWESYRAGLISIDDFWALSEKYRSGHLREYKYARDLENIYQDMDPYLKNKEQKLLDSLHKYKNRDSLKRENRQAYFENISDILRELYNYQQQIGTQYPEYYEQRLEQKYPLIRHIQSELDSQQVLIEFFNGKSPGMLPALYTFVISQKEAKIVCVDSLELEEPLARYYQNIRRNPLKFDDRKEVLQSAMELDSLGAYLRQQLLDPLDIFAYKEWIVIPHRSLYYLPLSSLPLTDHVTNSLGQSANRPRIIDQHRVTYAYSAQWWIEGQRLRHTNELKGLALLPNKSSKNFEIGFGEHAFLSNSSNWIVKSPDKGKTIQKDLETANFDLLYIAAHAKYEEEKEDTKLFFNKDHPLPSREVSKWPLKGKQVVLAACEGQLGPESKAEGMMSLSYYFAAAGANAITGALWEVDDHSTEKILSPKKGNLAQMGVDEIHIRIQDYRSEADILEKHPYFWAGFWTFQQKSMNAENRTDYNNNDFTLLISLAGAYIVFLLILIYRKKLFNI